ncbi:MAG: DUF2255 family protein [Rubrobacteraceae bacterium]
MDDSFDSDTLLLIDGAREVRIETSRDEDAPTHRATIWVVSVDGTVFVRSVRGGKGRWYREASANPAAALHVGDERILVRAVPVTDDATIAAVSEAYQEKYGRTSPGSTRAMLQPETLPTTLGLEPAREGASPN